MLSGLKPQGPPVRVTHMFTRADGQTHFNRVDVKLSRVPGVPAALEKSAPVRMTRCNLVRAARAVEGWHRADTRRLMIAVIGRAELELARRSRSSSRDGFAWMKT